MIFINMNVCPVCGAPLHKRINIKDLKSGEEVRKYEYTCKAVFRRIVKGPRKSEDVEYAYECENDTGPKQALELRKALLDLIHHTIKQSTVDCHFKDKCIRVFKDLNVENELLKSVKRIYKP